MKINLTDIRRDEPQIVVIGNYQPIIQSILDFDFLAGRPEPSIKAIINANKKSERYHWGHSEVLIPFYKNLESTPNGLNKKINFFLNLTSARRVRITTEITLSTLKNLNGGVIFGENTPEKHTLEIYDNHKNSDIFVIGPSSVGLLVPGKIKLGAIGGVEPRQLYNPVLYNPGNLAVFSASGGMTNELVNIVSGFDKRMSFCLSFGADRFPLTTPADAFLTAQNDPQTTHIVYFGELGGSDEYVLAELVNNGLITKPVVSYIGGWISEHFPTPPQFGHAKALAKKESETSSAKTAALRKAGINACMSFSDFVTAIKKLPNNTKKDIFLVAEDNMDLHDRKKALFASSVSHETPEGVEIVGSDLLTLAQTKSFSYIVSSMLLGKKIKSREMEEFADLVLKLLVDNGPLVSGAVNTMIAARAGKDLISSLAAGLLTIGKRFGGAVNGAATNWFNGASSNINPGEFVENFAKEGKPIEGIGHKKYRIDNPDPRVSELIKWSGKLKNKKYLKFARNIEKITASKKANLILNVDGTMAAIFLDILSEKEGLSEKDLKRLCEVEFFNAFFIIPRTVGFISHYLDQGRLDEGLFRLPAEEVAYIKER
jgi:ATP citrate (pro-S)-lyase